MAIALAWMKADNAAWRGIVVEHEDNIWTDPYGEKRPQGSTPGRFLWGHWVLPIIVIALIGLVASHL